MNLKYTSYAMLIFLIAVLCLSSVSATEYNNTTNDNYQLTMDNSNPGVVGSSERYLVNISDEIEYSDDMVIHANVIYAEHPDEPIIWKHDYMEFTMWDSQGNNWYTRINIVNGTGIIPIYNNPNITTGTYHVYCLYFDGYDWYGTLDKNISIVKGNPILDIDVKDIQYGEVADIKVNINQINATGNITITINGKNYTSNIVNKTASFSISNLDGGKYTIDAIYGGNDKYNIAKANATFNVTKSDVDIKINTNDINVGEDATIIANINPDVVGNLTFIVNNTKYIASIENGVAKVIIPGLSSGNYNVFVIFQGNENYNPSNATDVFNVTKLDSITTINVDDINVGEDATIIIKVSDNATGIVTIGVNNQYYNITINNGTGSLKLNNLTAGVYNVSADYLGDDIYLPSKNTTDFKVNKLNTPISVIIENKTDSVIIKIIVPSDATGNVTVTVNGKNYTSEIVNGTAVITINGLSEGSYNVTVVYDGDDKYLANSTNSSFIIQIDHDNEDGNGTDVNNTSKLDNNANTSNINANKQNNLNLNNTGNPLFMLLMALIIMLIPLRKRK